MDLRKKKNTFKTNPFIGELDGVMFLKPKATTILAKDEAVIDQTTGEIKRGKDLLIGRRKVVDKSQFAKIYMDKIADIMRLSKSAVKVLVYLSGKMDYDNKAFLNAKDDYEKIGYKTSQVVSKGLKELISKGIIAISNMPGFYWLNPIYVCKGERFSIYDEWITEEEAKRRGNTIWNGKIEAKKQLALKVIKDPYDGSDILSQENAPKLSEEKITDLKKKGILDKKEREERPLF